MKHVWTLFKRELRIGPRSPFIYWALVLPAFMTVILQGVFGGLFEPSPRLAIVDFGDSEITLAAEDLAGIEVTVLDDVDLLYEGVELNDYDAGLILREGFDDALRAGERPLLEFHVGGESLASNRAILGVQAIDLVREVEGSPAPVEVEVVALSEAELNFAQRTIPTVVIMAVAVAGVFIPASSLVQEKMDRTLSAVLATPARVNHVLLAKMAMGLLLGLATGAVALWMNDAFGAAPGTMVLAILIGTLMMAEIGVVLGSWAPDQNTLFAAWKGGAMLIIFPIIFYMFPSLPQWIAQLGITYYFLQPIFDIALFDATFADVWVDLAVALAICVALVPAVVWAGKRLERSIAA